MRIAALSTCDLLSRYVLGEVARARGRLDVIQVEMNWRTAARPRRGLSRLTSFPDRCLRAIERRLFRRRREQRDAERLAELLFETKSAASDLPFEPQAVLRSDELAGATAVARATVERLAPDLLLVHRAPLLPRELFATPRFGTWNLHYGFAPAYRGEGGLFWPLYFGDYERVGVTLHEIDDGVDTGRIIDRQQLPVGRTDDEVTLTAAAARNAVRMIVNQLARLEAKHDDFLVYPEAEGDGIVLPKAGGAGIVSPVAGGAALVYPEAEGDGLVYPKAAGAGLVYPEAEGDGLHLSAPPALPPGSSRESRCFRHRDRRIWHDLSLWLRRR